jgi:hypothetical protein
MVENQTLEQKVQFVQDYCRTAPEACFLGWRGADPIEPGLYKINMVFAYVVFLYKNIVRARKIAGTSAWLTNNASKIVFSTDLLRIRNGDRAKRIVLPDSLLMNEEAYPAGLMKNVEMGTSSYQISETRKSDVNLVDTLYSLLKIEDKLVATSIQAAKPTIYLSAYEKEVYEPRLNPELINVLRHRPGYDETVSLDKNFTKCFEGCFEKKTNSRWFINYDWVKGKGIPFVDLDSVHPVYRIMADPRKLDYEDEYFIFRIGNSLK